MRTRVRDMSPKVKKKNSTLVAELVAIEIDIAMVEIELNRLEKKLQDIKHMLNDLEKNRSQIIETLEKIGNNVKLIKSELGG